MYGIYDLPHLNGHPVQQYLLSAIGEVTSHHRRDGEGMRIGSAVGVAMRLLAIIDLAFEKHVAIGKRKIGFVGLSFKSCADDLRESPLHAPKLAEGAADAELLALGSSSRAVIDALMRLVRRPGGAVLPAKVQGLCSW